MDLPRLTFAEAGLFLILVAAPLAITPFSAAPFEDAKLVLVVAGALLVWTARLHIDRRMLLVAGTWVVATTIAAALGVEPAIGLTAAIGSSGGGLIVTLATATFVVAGAGLPDHLAARGARFLLGAGLTVSAIGIVFRLFPDFPAPILAGQSANAATFGNTLFAVAFVAAAVAVVPGRLADPRREVVAVAILVVGAASFGERSSYLLPSIAILVAARRGRVGPRRSAMLIGTTIVVLVAWAFVEPQLPRRPGSNRSVSQFVDRTVDSARFTVWNATYEGWTQRPILGWGPGATRTAYVRGATPAQLDDATRRWADAHDLGLEQLVSGGLVTAVPFVALVALLTARAWRGPRDRAWALGAAAALAAYAAFEPMHPLLTPMLGLVAGAAAAPSVFDEEAPARARPWIRRAGTIALAAGLAVSSLMLVASTLERWGTRYGEIWALRSARALQPWRQSADITLAFRLAFDGRGDGPGARAAAAEARSIMADTVAAHPWNVQVRLSAADLEIYLRDPTAGRAWIVEHVRRFPSDQAALEAFDRFIADASATLPVASP